MPSSPRRPTRRGRRFSTPAVRTPQWDPSYGPGDKRAPDSFSARAYYTEGSEPEDADPDSRLFVDQSSEHLLAYASLPPTPLARPATPPDSPISPISPDFLPRRAILCHVLSV